MNTATNTVTKVDVPAMVVEFINAYNNRDVDAMMACLTEDAVFENISNSHAAMVWNGLDAIRQLAEQSAAAFASRQQDIIRCVQEGDTIVLELQFTGVPIIDLPNGMTAGNAAILQGVSFIEMRDGKICKLRDFS